MDNQDRINDLVDQANDIYQQATVHMMTYLEDNGFFDVLDELAECHGAALIAEAEFQAAIGRITPEDLDQIRAAVNAEPECTCSGAEDGLTDEQVEQLKLLQAMVDEAARQAADHPDSRGVS